MSTHTCVYLLVYLNLQGGPSVIQPAIGSGKENKLQVLARVPKFWHTIDYNIPSVGFNTGAWQLASSGVRAT